MILEGRGAARAVRGNPGGLLGAGVWSLASKEKVCRGQSPTGYRRRKVETGSQEAGQTSVEGESRLSRIFLLGPVLLDIPGPSASLTYAK